MWEWGLLAAFVLGGLLVSRDAQASGGSGAQGPASSGGLARLRDVCQRAGLDDDWTTFLCAVAHHESRWNNLVGLGDPKLFPPWAKPNTRANPTTQQNEAKAAHTAYENNRERYADCEWSADRYAFGSGGLFGFLPANALKAFWNTELQCADPWLVFETEAGVILAAAYAKRLMGYAGFKKDPTWKNLNRGWALPSAMGKGYREGTDERFDKALSELGLSKSWGDRKVTSGNPVPGTKAARAYLALKGGVA